MSEAMALPLDGERSRVWRDTAVVVQAELFKLARRRALWVLLAAGIVLQEVFSYVIPYISYADGGGGSFEGGASRAELLASTLPGQFIGNTLGGLPVFAGALALVAGALVTGGEYGWGTVKSLLTQGPSRVAVAGGQLGALVVAALVGIVAMLGAGALTALGIALGESRPVDFAGAGAIVQGVAGGWLIFTMWMLLGAMLAVILRGIALPIGLGVVWVLGVENLLNSMATSVLTALRPLRDVLPGSNAGSLVTAVMPAQTLDPAPGVNDYVSGGRALATVAAYVVVSAVVAILVSRRRDVT